MAKDTLTVEELARLLREAEKAHADYERTLRHKDETWPDWYARFILRQMQKDQLSQA